MESNYYANLIEMWEDRIAEIEEKGNCNNKGGQPLFGGKFTKDEMLAYCQKMIKAIKKDESEALESE